MQDSPGKDEAERHRFLEEIRKKAEEAELKRLEDEERKTALRHAVSLPRPAPTKEDPAVEQKITDLRGRLSIALDRGKTERASQLVDELSTLVKDDSELALIRQRIAALQMEQDREKERVTKQGAGAGGEKAVRLSEPQKRKIADLLESADQAYQYEQYDRGLRTIQEILSLDPENSSAMELQQRIEAAQLLSDQIKEEEARRNAEEAKLFEKEPPKQVPVTPPQGSDAWGPLGVAPGEQHTFDGEMGTIPAAPPRLPLGRRIANSLSGIHVPKKLIVMAVAAIVVGVLVYVAVEQLKARVSLPQYSVLILPAQTAATDSSAHYIAAGLTTDLIDDLASVPDLRVFAATTSSSLRDSRDTPTQIARTLGANYLLQWSVSGSSEGVAIQLELSDTLSQQPLVRNQYQSSFRELPALRLEIARLLAGKIGLDSAALGLVRPPPTSVPAAYDAYLRGRALLQQDDSSSIWNALAAFEAACQADSNFADAFAATAWTRLRAYDGEIDTARVQLENASFAVDHASALGYRSAEMYRAKGMLEQFRGRYERALQQVEHAVAVAPSDAESQRRLSLLYVARNRPDDALKAARRAVTDDPRNVESFTMLGLVQQLRGEYDDALKSYREGMRLVSDSTEYACSHYADLLVYTLQPGQAIELLADRVARSRQSYLDYYRLGRVYQISGKPKQEWERALLRSKELLTEKLQSNPDDAVALTYLALVHTRLGEVNDAGAAATRAKLIGGEVPDVLYNLARVYAVRRDLPQAIDYLSKAVDRRYSLATILDMDFYNLRSEPVFLRTITRY